VDSAAAVGSAETCRHRGSENGRDREGRFRRLDVGRQWYKSVAPEQRAYGYYYDRMPIVDKGQYAEMDLFRKVILAGGPSVTDVVRGALANLTAWAALES